VVVVMLRQPGRRLGLPERRRPVDGAHVSPGVRVQVSSALRPGRRQPGGPAAQVIPKSNNGGPSARGSRFPPASSSSAS
jgi:hypothetical protein